MITDGLPTVRTAAMAAADAAVDLLGVIDGPFCGELEDYVAAVRAAAKTLKSRTNWVALELEEAQ